MSHRRLITDGTRVCIANLPNVNLHRAQILGGGNG
jgi:hypothetical protein